MRPRSSLLLLTFAVLGCVPERVRWSEAEMRGLGVLADSVRLDLAADGTPVVSAAWTPATWPSERGQCLDSRRAVRDDRGAAYASWFTVRPDSSVVLRAARSDDGGVSWRRAVTADSMDVGRTGCARPVPFLAVDAQNGYVHLAYHLVAREGAGVFFTHSMDDGMLFHEPVPIVYGDRPSAAAVASRGDTVVVAYEDPNSRLPRVALAVSRLQGHIFEAREAASDATGEARAPRVALRGDRVVLAWTASQRGGATPRIVWQRGTLRW